MKVISKARGWLWLKWYGLYRYPKVVTLRRLHPEGVQFNVTEPLEMWRVQHLDGEYFYFSLVLGEILPDDVLFDIGACIGLFSLHAAARCQQVFAFEPEPELLGHMKENCYLNKCTNMHILPWVISAKSEKIKLYTDGISGKSPSLYNTGYRQSIIVQSYSLDELIFSNNLTQPSMIKLDIEGAEWLALQGMKKILTNCPPRIMAIEIHPDLLQVYNVSLKDVTGLMMSFGYKSIYHAQRDTQMHYIFKHD